MLFNMKPIGIRTKKTAEKLKQMAGMFSKELSLKKLRAIN